MAAAFFNAMADRRAARAESAGSAPAERVHPEVVGAMRELGFDLSSAVPRHLTAELAAGARLLVTMGCGDACPYVPGLRVEDWPLADPKGRSAESVKAIRDEVRLRVADLVSRLGVGAAAEPDAPGRGRTSD